MQALRRRHGVVKAIRGWFDEQDFLEVATPVRVRAPSPEVQFDPIAAGDGYLITSPEFQMKRMLVGGFEKIYQIGPCFRGSERGRLHNPEFTMLEWYRVDEPFSKLIEDVRAMLASIPEEWVSPEVHAVCAQEWPVRRVSELIEEHWRVQLEPEENSVRLREKLRAAGQGAFLQQERLEQERDFEVIFSRMWDRFESVLGRAAPLFVIDWPQRLASLAQFNHKGWAQRVEVYVGGMELANGFLELCDPAEQQRRFMADLERRRVAQKSELPLDSLFLEGLSEGLPPSVGMAMGIERLITWLSGEESIQSAMGFVEEEIFLVK